MKYAVIAVVVVVIVAAVAVFCYKKFKGRKG